MTTGLLLLAAGRSERYGPQDKLLAPIVGRPMVIAALEALSRPRIAQRLAVVSSREVADVCQAAGCPTLMLPPGLGQGDSLAAGARALQDRVSRLLIGLGDMPWLNGTAVDDLLDLSDAHRNQPVCAALGDTPMPPAVFPGDWLGRLAEAKGDVGARGLLRGVPPHSRVRMPPALLGDVDRVENLSDGRE